MISVRQTKKGDWLVFQAVPATFGVGIKKVGSLAGGYTTGYQYDRFDTEEEANKYAESLAKKFNTEIVEWQYKQSSNPQFSDLPKLYPTEKQFNSKKEAENAGWIYISPNKTIGWYNGMKIWCKDITPGNSFGYKLAIVADSKVYLESTEVWIDGKFSNRFRYGDIVDIIDKIRQSIDAS